MKKAICLMMVVLVVFCSVSSAMSEAGTELTPLEKIQQWKQEYGYDFPIYGKTSADLSPISDYLTLLEKNGVMIHLPDLSVTHNEENGYDWIYSNIANLFHLRYIWYFDGSRYSLTMELPRTYRARDVAFMLLISSMCSVDSEEAAKIYQSLLYNVIGEWCTINQNDCVLTFYEPRYSDGQLAGFSMLEIEKRTSQ